jgi:hypothetical protein
LFQDRHHLLYTLITIKVNKINIFKIITQLIARKHKIIIIIIMQAMTQIKTKIKFNNNIYINNYFKKLFNNNNNQYNNYNNNKQF